jgi:hypothetical protein
MGNTPANPVSGRPGLVAQAVEGAEERPAVMEGNDTLKSNLLGYSKVYGGGMSLRRLDVDITVEDTDTSAASTEEVPIGALVMGASAYVVSKSDGCVSATMDVGLTSADTDGIADGVAITVDAMYTALVDGNTGFGIPVHISTADTVKITPNTAPTAGESFVIHATVWYFFEEPADKSSNMG